MTTTTATIIESFITNFHANVVSIEYYREQDTEGSDELISLDIFSNWLISNYPDMVREYKYYNEKYCAHEINYSDMINNIETFRKDIQNEFLNYYLNTFKK